MTDTDDAEMETGYEVVEAPRDVRIERETRDMYEALQEDEASPYQGAQLMQIFLNAAAVGSDQGLRQPLEGETRALFNVSSLADKDHTLLRSIAWKETEDEEIYYNHKRMLRIASEFANGGIRHLYRTRLGMGDNVNELLSDYVTRWRDLEGELEERSLLDSTE
jgi:hypothetical protein